MNTLPNLSWVRPRCAWRPCWPVTRRSDVCKPQAAIEASVEAHYPKLDALYKEIHAHPNRL